MLSARLGEGTLAPWRAGEAYDFLVLAGLSVIVFISRLKVISTSASTNLEDSSVGKSSDKNGSRVRKTWAQLTQAPGLRHGISTIPNLEPASHITGGSVLGSTSTSRSFPQRDMHRPSQNINRHIIPRPSSLTSDVVAVLIRSQARGKLVRCQFHSSDCRERPCWGAANTVWGRRDELGTEFPRGAPVVNITVRGTDWSDHRRTRPVASLVGGLGASLRGRDCDLPSFFFWSSFSGLPSWLVRGVGG